MTPQKLFRGGGGGLIIRSRRRKWIPHGKRALVAHHKFCLCIVFLPLALGSLNCYPREGGGVRVGFSQNGFFRDFYFWAAVFFCADFLAGCFLRESETTIKIKFSLFRGGLGRGAERKIVQNAIFHGKRHDNKILKVKILLSRNFVVMAQAPIFSAVL